MQSKQQTSRALLIGVDGVAYLLVTLAGFASHATLTFDSLNRILATFVPFFAAWLLIAPWLGVYDPGSLGELRPLWRVPLAVAYSAPLGALGRAVWLRSPILPLFLLIMVAVAAPTMTLWRWIYGRWVVRRLR